MTPTPTRGEGDRTEMSRHLPSFTSRRSPPSHSSSMHNNSTYHSAARTHASSRRSRAGAWRRRGGGGGGAWKLSVRALCRSCLDAVSRLDLGWISARCRASKLSISARLSGACRTVPRRFRAGSEKVQGAGRRGGRSVRARAGLGRRRGGGRGRREREAGEREGGGGGVSWGVLGWTHLHHL